MKKLAIVIFVLSFALFISTNAHVPIDGIDSDRIENAQQIENPTKSWAIYSSLTDGNDVDYYKFEIDQAETIYIQLFIANRNDQLNFLPSLAVMGSGLEASGNVPGFVETTTNVIVVSGERSDPEYESFGPSNFIPISVFSQKAPESGTYFFAVYSQNIGGNYGLAVGLTESFTITEIILNPINVFEVYQWQGQSILFILLPYLMTFTVGIFLFLRKNELNGIRFAIYLTGLGFTSSGIAFFYQMIYNIFRSELEGGVIITMIIGIIQISLGWGIIAISQKSKYITVSSAILLLVSSIVGLFVWAGFLLGPAIGFVLSIFILMKSPTINNSKVKI